MDVRTFVQSVEIKACRVNRTPKLIFLCGGLTAESGDYRSVRDFFYRYLKDNAPHIAARIRLAETVNDWFDEGIFSDLLELELYLADSSDLTILFVESPGSIAELGAFAVLEALRNRTLAVLNTKHPPSKSFIADGPVRRIRGFDPTRVHYFEWDDTKLSSSPTQGDIVDLCNDLIEYLNEQDKRQPKEVLLDPNSHGHAMFLVADLVDLIGVTTLAELTQCLELMSIKTSNKVLRQYLKLLEHLGLLKTRLYSNYTYYLSKSTGTAFIRYDFSSSTKAQDRDRDRIKLLLRQSLDEKRMKVYRKEHFSAPPQRSRYV